VLDRFRKQYSNLRTTEIKKDFKFIHGKKLALTIGIKAAKHAWVLLTDADCRPASPLWISGMHKHFGPPNDVVLGYGRYEPRKGLLDKFIRFDTFFIAMQYISFAVAGFPYMGVGRNLGYKRSLFFENKGFASHLKLESGDDDLFINEVAEKGKTGVEISHLAHTISVPSETWSAWFRQKRRHLTTGMHYKVSTRILLGLEISSRLIFYASFLLLVINKIFLPYVLLAFLIRTITSIIILNKGMNRLNEKNLLIFSPIFDIIILMINIYFVCCNLLTIKRSRWR
jgi:cellulose synthase/poly-beta-1,6-N-acetylglucosamine synthase-like glycosyltransferase